MNRYWDLTERERSGLSSDDVEAFGKVELMEKGVARIEAPTLEELEEIDLPQATYYVVEYAGRYASPESLPMLFRDAETADAFLKLAPEIKRNEYSLGNQDFVAPLKDARIKSVSLPCEQDMLNRRSILERNNAKRDRNNELRNEYDKAAREMKEALSGMWDDYYQCLDTKKRHERIKATLEEYKTLSGNNEVTAIRFLVKAFSESAVEEAFDWFGLSFPSTVSPDETTEDKERT